MRFPGSQTSIGDSHSARESGLAVDHQYLAMRPIVHARDVVPVQRMKHLQLHASAPHGIHDPGFDPLASYPVEKHVDLHAGARAF
jgi:hypothetical protein